MSETTPIWKAEHVRVSLFSRELWATDISKFIVDSTGLEVVETTTRPANAENSAVAKIDSKTLFEVRQQLNRIDFVIRPKFDVSIEDGLPLLDDATVEMERLAHWVFPWITTQPTNVVRVAIGCAGLLPMRDNKETYAKLAQLLPMVTFSPEDSDFQLRINRPIFSKSVDVKINVLATWAAVNVTAGLIGMGSNVATPMLSASQSSFVQCHLDVNTDAVRTDPIDVAKLPKLLEEVLAISEKLFKNSQK